MSQIAAQAGPVVDSIFFLSYALIAVLSVLVVLMLIGVFPFSARLAPVYRSLGLRDLEWIAVMRGSIRDSEWIEMPTLEARFRRCVEIAVGRRRRRLRSIALFALAYALINEARWDEAAACLNESPTLARERGHSSDLANALRGTAALYGMRGDLDAAQPFLNEAAALLPRLRPRMVSALWLDIGWLASQRAFSLMRRRHGRVRATPPPIRSSATCNASRVSTSRGLTFGTAAGSRAARHSTRWSSRPVTPEISP